MMDGLFTGGALRSKRKSVEWYTPDWLFAEMQIEFDLDPSSPYDMNTSVPAVTKYTIFDNGLSKPWFGRVWLNPPYGQETPIWVQRFIEHRNGIALLFSRTDASWCQHAMRACDAMLFVGGRIEFVPGKENQHKKSRSGAGSVMFAFGDECVSALKRLSGRGFLVQNKGETR